MRYYHIYCGAQSERSCNLSGAMCHFLKDIQLFIIIIMLSQKLANYAIDHAWIYPPSQYEDLFGTLILQ